MALLRRFPRLFYIQTRFTKFRDKSTANISRVNYKISKNNVRHSQILAKPSSWRRSYTERAKPEKLQNEELASSTDRMRYADLKQILSKKANNDLFSDPVAALRLLENCKNMYPDARPKERYDLVRETWRSIEKFTRSLTTEHYNVLLAIYLQNPQYFNVDEFLRQMRATPDQETFHLLLKNVAEIGDYAQALTIMAKIKEIGYPVGETVFNSLLLAYSVSGDIDGAQDIVVLMEAAAIEPNSVTYYSMSRGFAVKGDIQSLERILKTQSLTTGQLLNIVKTLSLSGYGKYVSKVMRHLSETVELDKNEVVNVVVELIYSGKTRDAFEIINCLLSENMDKKSSVNFTDFFIYEIVKSDTPTEEVIEICESLTSSGKNSSALLKVTEAALRLKKEYTALRGFQALRKNGVEIRPHFYWPLLVNAALNKLESDVIKLVKKMIDEEVYPDYETLRDYVIPYLAASEPLMVVRKLQDCGIKISEILTPVLSFLLENGDIDKAISLTNKIKGKTNVEIVIEELVNGYKSTRDLDATMKLLKNLNYKSDEIGKFLSDLLTKRRITLINKELRPLVSVLVDNKIKISRLAADVLKPRIMRLKEPNDLLETIKGLVDHKRDFIGEENYDWIPHPRVMTPEQLENHFADLTAQEMNTRGVLRRLLQVYCGKNNLKKAQHFAQIFTDKGFEWTPGMISSMLSLYAANDLLEEADTRYKELRSKYKDFKIDDHKVLDYATSLVRNDKFERALEILNDQKYVKTSPDIIRNCWRLLNAVAVAGDPLNTRKTFDLLIRKKYCGISNHVLAPLIKTHLINGEIQAAISQLKECVIIYKKVPLQQEIIRAILDASVNDPQAHEQLSEVLKAIKRIHGDSAADTQLLMAMATKKKDKGLKKLLIVRSVTLSV